MDKTTSELLNELKSENNIENYTERNRDIFMDRPLTEYLEILLENYSLKKAEVINRAAIATVYGYQIFDGKKNPKRDKVIQLAFGFGLTLEDTQKLLCCAGLGELYAKIKRDALIIYAINNKFRIEDMESLLYKMDEKGLENINE